MILASMGDSVVQFVTVTLIFAGVLALVYFTTRWIGSYQKKQMSYGNIQIIESMRLSSSKVLEIVKAGDKCFLIAVCKDTITTIGEINEDTLELKKPEKTGEAFGAVFSRFKVVHKGEEENEKQDPDN